MLFTRDEPVNPHFFVGREEQLAQINTALEMGALGVVIIGPAGSGKTSLARIAASRLERAFPGGIFFASASRTEGPQHLLDRALPPTRPLPALLVVEEAHQFDKVDLRRLVLSVRLNHPFLRMLLTSQRAFPLPEDYHQVTLEPLTLDQFRKVLELGNAFVHGEADEPVLNRLFRAACGSPALANLAAAVIRDRAVASWDELLEYLDGFHTPGLVRPDGQPILRDSEEHRRIVIDVSSANSEIVKILKRAPELAWNLPPRRFEEIVAEILEQQGYDVTLTPASGDGGFDIYAARKEGLGKFLYLVECKRYVPPNKVGVEIVRALYGVVQTQRATAGAIVTTSFFTSGAEEFQREAQHQMHLHNYIVLQKWIEDFPLTRVAAT